MGHYAVGVALDDDGGIGGDNLVAGLLEAVEGIAFVEECGRRGIYVLGVLVAERPAAEANYAAGDIGDGEYQAVNEFVLVLTGNQAGVLEEVCRDFSGAGVL